MARDEEERGRAMSCLDISQCHVLISRNVVSWHPRKGTCNVMSWDLWHVLVHVISWYLSSVGAICHVLTECVLLLYGTSVHVVPQSVILIYIFMSHIYQDTWMQLFISHTYQVVDVIYLKISIWHIYMITVRELWSHISRHINAVVHVTYKSSCWCDTSQDIYTTYLYHISTWSHMTFRAPYLYERIYMSSATHIYMSAYTYVARHVYW